MPRINFKTATPDEITAYLRKRVRQALGDAIENKTTIIASHGRYELSIPDGDDPEDGTYVKFARSGIKGVLAMITSLGEAA